MIDTFSRAMWISMMGHGIVAMLLFLRAVILPSQPIEVRSAIRVDVIGLPPKEQVLPDKPATPEPPKPVSKAEEVKAKPVKPPEAKPKAPTVDTKKPDLKKSQKSALDKLKALDALNKIKDEVSKEKAAAAPKPTQVAGNKLNAGNALTGLEKLDYDRYFDDIKAKILDHWALPQWLADHDLKASVTVLIDDRGYVTKKMIRRSSGNEVFDAKAIEAIEAASPLPEPPDRLRGLLSTSGITFNFPE